MNKSKEHVLLVLGILVGVVAGISINTPGYMDAEYYFVTGLGISRGDGFTEPFIWNYLNQPSQLPNTSHGYWMPLTSFLAASLTIFGNSFRLAQIPFLLLFVFLPLLTARYSLALTNDEDAAFIAGLLAAFPGFFLPFFLTTDMFILYAWIGTLFFWTCHIGSQRISPVLWMASGIFIGLAHLARADGLLLLLPFLYLSSRKGGYFLRRLLLGLGGYLLIMGPWFFRNLGAYGTLLPAGTQSALWLRSYQDLFRYPASDLGPGFLLNAGWVEILQTRLAALGTNFQRVIAENGLIFLLPLMLVGVREKWDLIVVRSAILFWAVLLIVMSIVFPFAGAQGGIFHSSAALMPTLWMLTPFGLRSIVTRVGAVRDWDVPKATRNFGWIFVGLAAVFTLGVFVQRVYGIEESGKRWNSDANAYHTLGDALIALDPQPGVVAVNNPPGFYAATGVSAVVVPSGGEDALRRVITDFQVEYVVLDQNLPAGLESIYERQRIVEWLVLVEEIDAGNASPILVFKTDQRLVDP